VTLSAICVTVFIYPASAAKRMWKCNTTIIIIVAASKLVISIIIIIIVIVIESSTGTKQRKN